MRGDGKKLCFDDLISNRLFLFIFFLTHTHTHTHNKTTEIKNHVHDFLEEIRPGPHENDLHELFNYKLEPELEALIAAQHYFENPETSVLAERMLEICELDMVNCPLLQHIPEEDRIGSKVYYADADEALQEEGDESESENQGRKLQQEKFPVTPAPPVPEGSKSKWLDIPSPPSNYGAVSSFQFYRDEYCTPPSVSPATFNFVSRTNFNGVTYAFAILGGSATWSPKDQTLSVQKPQVVYSKQESSWEKTGGRTSKGSASEKSCDFSSPVYKKGEGIGYSKTLGIEQQFFKPTANSAIYIDAKRPETYPSLGAWFRCWIEPGHPECAPPTIALSPLLLNLPFQILSFLPSVGFLGK